MQYDTASEARRKALVRVSSSKTGAGDDSLGLVRSRVCALVDELKAQGQSPERVTMAVKRIARDADLGLAHAPLLNHMVTWCLDHYCNTATERD
ncbi:MAG: hypothetical protein ABI442_18690 [Gemmatimonadaceae bacterium]